MLNLGSSFLERLGNQATNGFDRSLRNNPGGGGASEATEAPRYRTWGELYGISTTTGAQGDFVGDKRQTMGGVAGFGAQIAPGVNVGFSVDQSHTDDRRAAGAAVGDARSDAARLQRLRRQGAMDLGDRAGARLRQCRLQPRHRLRLCERAVWRAASTAR